MNVSTPAWASLAIGKPFTAGIAKREVPQEYWGSDKFRHINRVLTSVWAVAFTATAIVVWVIDRKDLGDVADGIVSEDSVHPTPAGVKLLADAYVGALRDC